MLFTTHKACSDFYDAAKRGGTLGVVIEKNYVLHKSKNGTFRIIAFPNTKEKISRHMVEYSPAKILSDDTVVFNRNCLGHANFLARHFGALPCEVGYYGDHIDGVRWAYGNQIVLAKHDTTMLLKNGILSAKKLGGTLVVVNEAKKKELFAEYRRLRKHLGVLQKLGAMPSTVLSAEERRMVVNQRYCRSNNARFPEYFVHLIVLMARSGHGEGNQDCTKSLVVHLDNIDYRGYWNANMRPTPDEQFEYVIKAHDKRIKIAFGVMAYV